MQPTEICGSLLSSSVAFDFKSTRVMPYQPATNRKRPSWETVMPLGSGSEWGGKKISSFVPPGRTQRTTVGGSCVHAAVRPHHQIIDQVRSLRCCRIFCEQLAVAQSVTKNASNQTGLRTQLLGSRPKLAPLIIHAQPKDDSHAALRRRNEVARVPCAIDYNDLALHAAKVEAFLPRAPGNSFGHQVAL